MGKGKIDLHMHSFYSDGDTAPAEVAEAAAGEGVTLMALTDHDCAMGIPEAKAAAERMGIALIPGVEFDNAYLAELHIQGLGMDTEAPVLKDFLTRTFERRRLHVEAIADNLERMGIRVREHLRERAGVPVRTQIGLALVEAGYVKDLNEAFARYIGRRGSAYVEAKLPEPEEVLEVIHRAGGVAVLAHPCSLKGDVRALIDRLCRNGLWGLEAYYPTSTPGQTELFLSLASQYGLYVTCGSDFHGGNRPGAVPGCAYRENDRRLERTREFFESEGSLCGF